MQHRTVVYLKNENDSYSISIIGTNKLEKICKLYNINFTKDDDKSTQYYIKINELGNFIRAMRRSKIDVRFC